MYNSKEIRWFFREQDKIIAKWFSGKGLELSTTKSRRDFYLPIPKKEDISVKLREGQVQIKQRHGNPGPHELTKNAKGLLEDWVRWGFDVEDDDALANSIIKNKEHNWIEVYKERMGLKITKDSDGSLSIHDIKDFLSFGCQVEYTRLVIDGTESFTFGLEWFGDEYLELDPSLIAEVLGDTVLKMEDSMGYPAFISI